VEHRVPAAVRRQAEIELLVGQQQVGVPVFPTMRLPATAAGDLTLTRST
jgi:hypothetical protein